MKTDRELLELAAKAAGVGPVIRFEGGGLIIGPNRHSRYWCPLTDDGDALRLAVQLCLHVTAGPLASAASWPPHGAWLQEVIEAHGLDRNAATRRAIVRAAAEIGIGGDRRG